MEKKHYDAIISYISARPWLSKTLITVNCLLTAIGYVAFVALIAACLVAGEYEVAAKKVIICAAGFCAVSALRYCLSAQRPYEKLDIKPLVDKTTAAKSFPSRHAFCMFLIAFAWIDWCFYVGCVLLAMGFILGCVRVVLGLHWPRDIAAAACFACLFGVLFVLF